MFPVETRILVVDDLVTTRMTEIKILNKLGFENIMQAKNGMEALKILHNQAKIKKSIDLILLDWDMPEINGLEMVKKMKNNEHLKDTPIIMVSANGQQNLIMEAIKNGVTAYILKPVEEETLKRKMELVWEKKHKEE